jgi:hypothetical protein
LETNSTSALLTTTSSDLVLAPYSDEDKDTDDDELNAGIKMKGKF